MGELVDDGALEDMRAYAEDLESRILELTERNDRLLAQENKARARLATYKALVETWRADAAIDRVPPSAGFWQGRASGLDRAANNLEAAIRGETNDGQDR